MRYILVMMVLAGLCGGSVYSSGIFGSGVSASGISTAIAKESNCKIIYPGDDPNKAYEALIARTDMGTLSTTNHRVLVLSPGTYISTGWLLDTDYIDVVSLSGNPRDTIISAVDANTVTQTCSSVFLRGITIKNTSASDDAGDRTTNGIFSDMGFLINVANNSSSLYEDMIFSHSNVCAYDQYSVFSVQNLGGTWRNCSAGDYAWRAANGKDVSGNFYYCTAGTYSFGGDNENISIGTGVISGKFYYCTSGANGFGGCGSFGQSCSSASLFIGCVSGSNSFALGRTFAGTAIDCTGGSACFAGCVDDTQCGTFSGKAIRCKASFGATVGSFGMDKTAGSGATMSGLLMDCQIGTDAAYLDGTQNAGTRGITTLTGQIIRCHPYVPIAKTADTTIQQIFSGAIYTNSGDTNAINFTLPAAVVGLEYTFIDMSNTDTADVTVTASGAETIGGLGTAAVGNDDNTFGIIRIKCITTGSWVVMDSTGAWN